MMARTYHKSLSKYSTDFISELPDYKMVSFGETCTGYVQFLLSILLCMQQQCVYGLSLQITFLRLVS